MCWIVLPSCWFKLSLRGTCKTTKIGWYSHFPGPPPALLLVSRMFVQNGWCLPTGAVGVRAEEFMASGSESSSFEMSFRMKMRWGLTDTTWRWRRTEKPMTADGCCLLGWVDVWFVAWLVVCLICFVWLIGLVGLAGLVWLAGVVDLVHWSGSSCFVTEPSLHEGASSPMETCCWHVRNWHLAWTKVQRTCIRVS